MLTGSGCHRWHCNTCWRNTVVDHRQSGRFLECLDDSFLLQVTEETIRYSAGPHIHQQWGTCWECESLRQTWLEWWWDGGLKGQEGGWKASSQPWTSWEQTGVFKDLLGSVLWDKVLEGREAQERWLKSRITSIKHKSSPFQQTGSETKCQEAFIDEQVAPDKTRNTKSVQKVETWTTSLGGMQTHCPSIQGWN